MTCGFVIIASPARDSLWSSTANASTTMEGVAGGGETRIVEVDRFNQETFLSVARRDPMEYYFYLLDWLHFNDSTRAFMAMEGGHVEGMLLMFMDSLVNIRAMDRAVEPLLDLVDLDQAEFSVGLNAVKAVESRYEVKMSRTCVLMGLERGMERLAKRHGTVTLGHEDMDEMAALMIRCDPATWGHMDRERLTKLLGDADAVGIRRDTDLASIAIFRSPDVGGHIGVVATDQPYRNLGMATSVVSEAVQRILLKVPVVNINVFEDNLPARKVYSKLGFGDRSRFQVMRGTIK